MNATADELRGWRLAAVEGLSTAIAAAPDAIVPAYPRWTNRDLAVHVVRILGNATIACATGSTERPSPRLPVGPDDEPSALTAAVRHAHEEAETALARAGDAPVWTPVGPRPPAFWHRRLLREAVLHRWDAEQAAGRPDPPAAEQAEELIDECCDTDVARAIAGADRRGGAVAIRTAARTWTVDLSKGSVTAGAGAAGSHVTGEAASVWLWLMRRDPLPDPVAVDDVDGSVAALTAVLDGFSRPDR